MHVALCDDNVADRKQFERLIGREADRRKATGENLFVDSFGNMSALLNNPMQYDVFYIDIRQTEGVSSEDVVNALIQKGVQAPIVLCCTEKEFQSLALPEHVFCIEKPIKAADLSESLNQAATLKKSAEALIELRVENVTQYVSVQEFMYAVKSGNLVVIHLTGGRVFQVVDSIMNQLDQMKQFDEIVSPSLGTLMNVNYIKEVGMLHAVMTDGTKIRISVFWRNYLKELCAQKGILTNHGLA